MNPFGKYIGLLDYLTEELQTSFRLGKQVWESEKNDRSNHRAQRQLVMDAIERARIRYKLANEDPTRGRGVKE